MNELPYRQIHLDFHTSPYIEGVGDNFNPDQFIGALKEGNVDSINIFAKCHHGMCYYPTEVGTMHPSLKFDLFGAMVKALRQADIGVLAYITVGWDEDSADKHPEWLQVDRNGVRGGKKPYETGYYRWRHLCHNQEGYIRHVLAHTQEILDHYEVKGLWYDIVFQIGCVCNECQHSMRALGLDPAVEADVQKHDFSVIKKFRERVTQYVHERNPEMLLYYNNGYHADIGYSEYGIEEKVAHNTHIEIESLPSGLWGYNHFPFVANYHNAQDYQIIGMTGKFHKSWADFGTLKNREALAFESFRMIANGAKCCIGDQLHPGGVMDETVYRRIGEVYRSLAAKEPWCVESRKVAEIGVLTANPDLSDKFAIHESDEGAMRMMMELHQPFDFITSRSDFSKYKLVILPDFVALSEGLAAKLEAYMQAGGKIILSNRSGLDAEGTGFVSEVFGVRYKGPAAYAPEYARMAESFRGGIDKLDYCFYESGTDVEALPGTEVLAAAVEPYFNRTYDRFSSHCQTPPGRATDKPVIVRSGNAIYISKPIFKDYIVSGVQVYREIVKQVMDLLYDRPLLVSDLPTTAETTIREQDDRHVLHILHYIPQRKSRETEIVEDVIPLYNRNVRVRLGRQPSKVYTAPDRQELAFSYADGYASVDIPEIVGHEMVVFESLPGGGPK